MSLSTLPRAADIRAARRGARRDVRIMTRTIKQAARRKGLTSIPALSKAAGIPLRRVALMWLGITLTITEMTGYMIRLDLTVADLFAGTGNHS